MKMKAILMLLWSLSIAAAMSACGINTETPISEPADLLSEAVPGKIVVYNSGLCTVLEAFGKADTIVGAYGPLAENYGVPSCGKWNEVDVESVIATGADAVFAYETYTTQEQISKLQDAGIACYFLELSDADTFAGEIAQLGELFGCQEKAKTFVDLYNNYDALLEERLAGISEPLSVYVEGTAKEPYKTANGTTAAHKLVAGAGLVNVYAENAVAYPERNLEAVINADPAVIVKLCGAGELPADVYGEYMSGLSGVTAADAGKVILLNNEVGTTAIGSIIGRLYVARFAYPELFADVDVDTIYQQLCEDFLGTAFAGPGAYAG